MFFPPSQLLKAAILANILSLCFCSTTKPDVSLVHRATPDAPNGYAPAIVPCPQTQPTIRNATGLSNEEIEWTKLRETVITQFLKSFLERTTIDGFDGAGYVDQLISKNDSLPRIAIAVSGGGYRALMNGAGALSAFDNRTQGSSDKGHVGGLLQASTYLSGLSGGSWVVGSLYVQNFTTVDSIVYSSSAFLGQLWQFDQSILEGPATLSIGDYYRELHDDVEGKVDAGFNKTITDYWGRALSYQLVNATDGGPSYTFSSIAEDDDFVNGRAPLPLIVALERPPGQLQIPDNSSVYEFNPWEMGSYDPSPFSFAPLKYAGSNFTNGTIIQGGDCIAGVDNAGFVMGTSSSLFNQAFLQISRASNVPDFLVRAINETLANIGEANKDIASWPNPFLGYNAPQNLNHDSSFLTLVDGGEDLQNIPLTPLILSDRQVDVIFAIDSSADTSTYWPNGTALVATYKRSMNFHSSNQAQFPEIPDQNTFINLGLNKRPTFFGCAQNASTGPLVVYLPNAPYSTQSNVSTFDLEYSDSDRNEIIVNGYNVATMGNGTADSKWVTCVACAILNRSLLRTNTSIPANCTDCYTSYCWNGTTNSTEPNTYEPDMIITTGSATLSKLAPIMWIISMNILILLVIHVLH